MKTCTNCEGSAFELATEELRHKVAGRAYIMNAENVTRCVACGETYVPGLVLLSFELLVAWDLISHGVFSGEVLRFARKALGFKAGELAALLDMTPQHFSKLENDNAPVQAQSMVIVAELVNDQIHGRTTTVELLKSTREAGPAPKNPVRLEVPASMNVLAAEQI